jgi:Na+/proline symporter
MLVAVCVSVYLIADELNTGLVGLVDVIQESQYSQMFFWDPKQDNYFFKQFFSGAFIAIVMTGLDQDMMQKNNSCKNIREAQMNMFSFSIVLVFVNLLFVSLGALLYIYSETKGIAIPSEVCLTCESGFRTRTDYLFPELALHHFSPLAGITFILGLIAAAYSSADSALTSLTTSFCVDFLNFEKRSDESKQKLNKTRIAVHISFTILLFLVILVFRYWMKEDVISNLFKAAGYTYGPLLGLFFFGIMLKREVKDKWVIPICIATPIITYIINLNSEKWFWGYQFGFEILILNGALTFLGLLAISKPTTKN